MNPVPVKLPGYKTGLIVDVVIGEQDARLIVLMPDGSVTVVLRDLAVAAYEVDVLVDQPVTVVVVNP